MASEKKLNTTLCSVGKDDQLVSPWLAFQRRFNSKRVRHTAWQHSASSQIDSRYSFTYVFRHSVRAPDDVQLLVPSENTLTVLPSKKTIKTSERNIPFLERTELAHSALTLPQPLASASETSKIGMIDGTTSADVAGHISNSDLIRPVEKNLVSSLTDVTDEAGFAASQAFHKTFYSPFCLQEMEQLGWNINQFKLPPAPLGNAYGPLPGFVLQNSVDQKTVDVSAYGNSLQSFNKTYNPSLMSSTILAPTSYYRRFGYAQTTVGSPTISDITYGVAPGVTGWNALQDSDSLNPFKVFSNSPYSAPLPVVGTVNSSTQGFVPSGFSTDHGSIVREVSSSLNSEDSKRDYGRFKSQLGKSKATFTFQNTGDATMIVEMVVHRPKEKVAFIPLGSEIGNPNTANMGKSWLNFQTDLNRTDIHPEIVQNYGKNYMKYHVKNQDRVMSDYIRKDTDVDINPRVKFLPTSYRNYNVNDVIEDPKTSQIAIGEEAIVEQGFGLMDIYRKSITIPANCRKTLVLNMPSVRYDPGKYDYNCALNELGYAVTFGVTGKKSRVIVPSGVATSGDIQGSRAVGNQAAPTTFMIYGSEQQVIYPVVLEEPEDYQANNARLLPVSSTDGALVAAHYNSVGKRDNQGRYKLLLSDGVCYNQTTDAPTVTRAEKRTYSAADFQSLKDDYSRDFTFFCQTRSPQLAIIDAFTDGFVRNMKKNAHSILLTATNLITLGYNKMTITRAEWDAVVDFQSNFCKNHKQQILRLSGEDTKKWALGLTQQRELYFSAIHYKDPVTHKQINEGHITPISTEPEEFLMELADALMEGNDGNDLFNIPQIGNAVEIEIDPSHRKLLESTMTEQDIPDVHIMNLVSSFWGHPGVNPTDPLSQHDINRLQKAIKFCLFIYNKDMTVISGTDIPGYLMDGEMINYWEDGSVMLFGAAVKGVDWDIHTSKTGQSTMVQVDQNQDGVPDQPILVGVDQDADGNPDEPILVAQDQDTDGVADSTSQASSMAEMSSVLGDVTPEVEKILNMIIEEREPYTAAVNHYNNWASDGQLLFFQLKHDSNIAGTYHIDHNDHVKVYVNLSGGTSDSRHNSNWNKFTHWFKHIKL